MSQTRAFVGGKAYAQAVAVWTDEQGVASKFDGCPGIAMLAPHVSRTDDKGAGASRGEAAERGADDAAELLLDSSGERTSAVQPIGACAVADERERTQLIADIMRLIRDPAMPEATRHAGINLIGWLARRRVSEVPHAIGIDEARESERRFKAARAKTR
jgi:hypothetical protein